MKQLNTTTLKKWALVGALAGMSLALGMGDALAQATAGNSIGTTVDTLGTQVNNLPKLVTALSMPVGLFLVIMGGINLVKLGKDANAENTRNVIFTLLAGVFVLSLNWIIPYFRDAGSLGAGTGTITKANVGGAWN